MANPILSNLVDDASSTLSHEKLGGTTMEDFLMIEPFSNHFVADPTTDFLKQFSLNSF